MLRNCILFFKSCAAVAGLAALLFALAEQRQAGGWAQTSSPVQSAGDEVLSS